MSDRFFFGLLFLGIWLLAVPVMGESDWRFDALLAAAAAMLVWALVHRLRPDDRLR